MFGEALQLLRLLIELRRIAEPVRTIAELLETAAKLLSVTLQRRLRRPIFRAYDGAYRLCQFRWWMHARLACASLSKETNR